MKKIIFSIFLTFLVNPLSFASDVVRNGGGISEQNILFAFSNLDDFISVCLESNSCIKEGRDRDLLTKIVKSLDEEVSLNSQLIQFKSEKKNPGFFIIDGVERVAITGDNIGDTIYFNTDLLYKAETNSINKSISTAAAIQILIHELGHHHKVDDHHYLDQLGLYVRQFYDGKLVTVFHNPFIYKLSATSIHHNSYERSGSLFIQTGDRYVDLTPLFNKVSCPLPNLRNNINPLLNKTVQFFNTNWEHKNGRLLSDKKSLKGVVVVMCDYKLLGDVRIFHEFEIKFDLIFNSYLRHALLRGEPKLIKTEKLYKIHGDGIVKF